MALNKQDLIKQELWRRGNLFWKCHPVQQLMYKKFYESPANSTSVWLLARQSGKSVLLAILALEQAIKKPNSVIKLLTDTKLHAESIFEPTFNMLIEDCPDDVKPKYNRQKFAYVFPHNKSQIQLAGSDGGHYERLRGQKSDLVLVDEAGFCSELEEIVRSVLLPTTTHTGGKVVLASTPPSDPSHDFHQFIEQAELNGSLTIKTLHDNPLLSIEQIMRIEKEMGGKNSIKFRREYLCELIREEESVVFPEFTPELQSKIVREWPKPAFYNAYESMDLGFKDMTVVLFAYHDFKNNKIIIEDELVLKGNDVKIPTLIGQIKEREDRLWTNPLTHEQIKPTLRVSDINYIVMSEIARISNGEINFLAAKKDDKEAAVNHVRVMLQEEKLIIAPTCVTLIRHLKNCKRDGRAQYKGRIVFGRGADGSHYDAADALIYLCRHVNELKNPYPVFHGYDQKDLYVHRPEKFKDQTVSVVEKMMGIRKFTGSRKRF